MLFKTEATLHSIYVLYEHSKSNSYSNKAVNVKLYLVVLRTTQFQQ